MTQAWIIFGSQLFFYFRSPPSRFSRGINEGESHAPSIPITLQALAGTQSCLVKNQT